MATSGSIDYTATVNDIIKEALTLCGVLAIGDEPSSQDVGTAQRTLQMLIKAWQAENVNIFAKRHVNVPLTAGTSVYTMDPPVIDILSAYIYDTDNISYQVEVISSYDWAQISNKWVEDSGRPLKLWHHKRTGSNNKVKLWPVPDDSTDVLVLHGIVQIHDADSTSDDVDYPKEWYLPLAYNLAYLIAPKYGIPVQNYQMIRSAAQEWKEIVQGFDREPSITIGVETYG